MDWYKAIETESNRVMGNLEGIFEYPEEVDRQEAIDTMHAAVDDLREMIRTIRSLQP